MLKKSEKYMKLRRQGYEKDLENGKYYIMRLRV